MKRRIDLITIIACALVVLIFSCSFLLLADREFSASENRVLSGKPDFSIKNLFSGEYTEDLVEYISDQFPARDTFVAIKAYSELALGKCENNGVIYGKDEVLIAKSDIGARLYENLDTVKNFQNAIDTPVYLAVLPTKEDVFAENLPKSYDNTKAQKVWQDYFSVAEELELNITNLYEPLCEQNNYYHTDHHYTTYGAFDTYKLLGETLGYTPKSKGFFKSETVSNNFCGTSMRTSGFYLAPKDEITLLRYEDDNNYTVIADKKQISLYDMSKLNTTDQYAVFLGGNHARVDITSGEDRPKLLIIRDSFADSLAPFLAIHYDLTLIDLRYYNDNVQQLICDEGFDCVLILESIDEFSTTKNLSYLRMAVEE